MRVCILGNNLTSLLLAKALINKNINIDHLILKKSYKPNFSRTIGISKTNIEFINKNIISIKKILWKLNKIQIYTENLKNDLLLNFENNNKQLFSIIKNFQFYEILKKNLLKNNKYKKKILNKYNPSAFDRYDLTINCDSTSSITRKYFSKKISKNYDSLAFTTIIKHKKIKNNIAIQIFTKNGPLAFLPLSSYNTSIVYSITGNRNLTKQKIKELIQNYNFKYEIKNIDNIESFQLKSSNLRSYYYKNILAFGDLLHKIHPLAGQGFNMTIRDIKTLIDIIQNRIELGLPLDKSINFEFEKKSKHKNFIFSNGIDFVYEFFNAERKISNNILSKSVQFVGKNSYLNKLFTKIADKGSLY